MVLLFPLLVFSTLFTISSSTFSPQPGICYGQLGNNLPPPWKSVELIESLKAKRVKIYYASSQILNALENTTFQVSILVPNKLISRISTIQTFSNHWVQNNVVPFYPHTVIRYLLVGNGIISTTKNETWFKKIFIQHLNDSSSSTASKSDRAPEGPYCEWSPKTVVKSNSTGFSSYGDRFRDLKLRSNGQNALVFLNSLSAKTSSDEARDVEEDKGQNDVMNFEKYLIFNINYNILI